MTRKTRVIALGPVLDFSYVETNVTALDAVGFDGYICTPTYLVGSVLTNATNQIWGPDVIPWNTIAPLWSSLPSVPLNAMTDNFLRANASPGGIDWFDAAGMANVTLNMLSIMQLAKDSYCKGVFFDNEPYGTQIWEYAAQPQMGSHTFAEYKTQVYNYAYTLGLQLWAIFPECIFFNSLNYWASYGSGLPEQDRQYGLLPSFFDGLLDSMADFPCARFIQGNEFSYWCQDTTCMNYGTTHTIQGVYRGSSAQFGRHARNAYAAWVAAPPYDNVNTSGNYYTPAGLTANIELKAQYVDQYVWIYTGEYNWINPLPPYGTSFRISPDYDSSILNALPNLP